MARQRSVTQSKTAAASSGVAGMDPNILAAAIASGKDINTILAEMQAQKAREEAQAKFGTINVVVNRNMPIKFSEKTGRFYCLGTMNGAVGLKVQGERVLTQQHIEKLGRIEIDLGLTEGAKEQVEEYRATVGGNHQFEFVLSGESQLIQLEARFPQGHESEKMPIYILDPSESHDDPRNWTSEETELKLMKWQIRVMASGYLNAETALIPGAELPADDAEFDAFLESAGKTSALLQAKSLDAWRDRQRVMQNEAAAEEKELLATV